MFTLRLWIKHIIVKYLFKNLYSIVLFEKKKSFNSIITTITLYMEVVINGLTRFSKNKKTEGKKETGQFFALSLIM